MNKLYLLLLIPTALLGGCGDDESWRDNYRAHYASSWTVTPGGITRDAGPFASIAEGFTSDAEIDAALDAGRADFIARFPEYAYINPPVHLTDAYSFWTQAGWAAGQSYGESVSLAIWSRLESASDPGNVFLKRSPEECDGVCSSWRYTGAPLVPAYQHELLHVAIGDPSHSSAIWDRLR